MPEHGPACNLASRQGSLVPLSLLLCRVFRPPQRLSLTTLAIFRQSQVSDLFPDPVKRVLQLCFLLCFTLNLLIQRVELLFPQMQRLPHILKFLDQCCILCCALVDILQTFFVVLASCLLELCDEIFHVLALSIQLFDRFWVFPLLILDFFSPGFDEGIKQVHQPINVLLLVFFLDKFVDFGCEI